jgi:S-adenosylmethionine:tRNA ribosyltransferase-isomerase
VQDSQFVNLPNHLLAGDLLVLNNTRVYPARLIGRRVPSGGAVECLLLAPSESASEWDALVHPGQKLKPGSRVLFEAHGIELHGEILARHFHGRRTVRLWTSDGSDVAAAIDRIGHIPLPPYIKRDDRPADRDRYQTVYAREKGSIAAPTAGLHFTDRLLERLAQRGVERTEITLHVGYGTFKPVRADRVEDHVVDAEPFTVPAAAADALTRARQEHRRVIAVGTTTTRALESLHTSDAPVGPAAGVTRLFIHPGHEFRMVNGLITNFHLPRSSLLMLVAAFAGLEHVLAAYRHAIEQQYRFYSYGDAMLIL